MFDKLYEVITGDDKIDRYKNCTSILLQLVQYIDFMYPKECPEKGDLTDVMCKIIQEYKR